MKVDIGTNIPQSEVVKMFVLKTNIKKDNKKSEEMENLHTEGKEND